jgi:glycosyltransferase involved in cell wall biosynthesis
MNVMQNYLRSYNAAVVWSGKDESWCRTVTECMAAGMVVIAHDIGAIPEQVKDGDTGLLFRDEDGLMDALNKVTFNLTVSDRMQMGKRAREWALTNVGPARMKADYYPLLMKALMQKGA